MTGKKGQPARPDPWPELLRAWLDEKEARIQVALQKGRSSQGRAANCLRQALEGIAEARQELARRPAGATLAFSVMLIQELSDLPNLEVIEVGRRQHSMAGKGGVRTKRQTAIALRRAVQTLKTQNPDLSNKAAARKYLHQTDHAWPTSTDDQRHRKVNALLRRISRAKKNSGQ